MSDDSTDALAAQLMVWERLEVGPVRVEPQRLVMPYTCVPAGADATPSTQELVYRWDTPVFDPDDPASIGLASVIGAQLALNYGLFCRQLVFRGPFDRHDRQLLRDMAANTAREIYVNKLLKPNAFLNFAAPLPVERRRSYLLAQIVFTDATPKAPAAAPWASAATDDVAVLSSGGKESLTSLGLLEELGRRVHPLYINESGRHWLTALNAFRDHQATRPDTARVWCNCDRVYNWALRQLPFVRPDFQSVRADDYPIRLWTMAVFLFGVLPLMRTRGVGRLVVGDEYDSTVKLRYEGIPHYGGYYDQSRFFDEALSRYFRSKGWGVVSCSILRSASELLIEHILTRRYPALFAQQVSCHAASAAPGDDKRVRPCGRCEKCRRIVGMLTALGADPQIIGYGPEVVGRCLAALAALDLRQGPEGAHLAFLLVGSGHIPASSPFGQRATPFPETMALRFDAVASPLNTVPSDLRAGVHRLLLRDATGAVQRRSRTWVGFNPLSSDASAMPHPSEAAADGAIPPEEQLLPDRPAWKLAELTWPQARRRFAETEVAILPVGAIEQHGPHLPLDIDAWDANYLAERVAERCARPQPLVLPLIPYGVSYHHEDFPGTLSVSPQTLAALVHEVGMSAVRYGIRKLVIINGHGGNVPALHFAAQLLNRDAHIFTCVDTGETSDAETDPFVETPNDVHAGEYETSTALATRPELVYMQHARAAVPRFDSRYLDFGERLAVGWYARTKRISESGVMGDPTRATAAKGEQMWEVQIANLVELVNHLGQTSLDALLRPSGGP